MASSLPDELVRKAKFMLNESPDKTAQDIQAVRDQIETRPDIEFIRRDDTFVLQCLRARKFDVFEAFKLYANYFEFQQLHPELFKPLLPADPSFNALYDGFPSVLPEPDQLGRRIVLLLAYNWESKRYGLLSIFHALLQSVSKLVEDEKVQINGLVMLLDWTNFTFKQSTGIHPRVMKLMVHALHECFPVRFEEVHFINQPWYIEAAFNLVKPFIENDSKHKVFMHGNNLARLYNHVCQDNLPAELGGSQPSYHIQPWISHLLGESDVEMCSNGIKARSQTFPNGLNPDKEDPPLRETSSQQGFDDSLLLA